MPVGWWVATHALALRDPATGCLLIYDSDEWNEEDVLDHLNDVSKKLDDIITTPQKNSR